MATVFSAAIPGWPSAGTYKSVILALASDVPRFLTVTSTSTVAPWIAVALAAFTAVTATAYGGGVTMVMEVVEIKKWATLLSSTRVAPALMV